MKNSFILPAVLLAAMTLVACAKGQTTPTSVPTSGATPTATEAATPTDKPATPTSTPTNKPTIPPTDTPTPTPTSTPTPIPMLITDGRFKGYYTTGRPGVYFNNKVTSSGDYSVTVQRLKSNLLVSDAWGENITEGGRHFIINSYDMTAFDKQYTLDFNLHEGNDVGMRVFPGEDRLLVATIWYLTGDDPSIVDIELSLYDSKLELISDCKEDLHIRIMDTASLLFDDKNNRVICFGVDEFLVYDLTSDSIKTLSKVKIENDPEMDFVGYTDNTKALLLCSFTTGQDGEKQLHSFKNYVVDIFTGEVAEAELPDTIGYSSYYAQVPTESGVTAPSGTMIAVDKDEHKTYIYDQAKKNTVEIESEEAIYAFQFDTINNVLILRYGYTVDGYHNRYGYKSYSLETGKFISKCETGDLEDAFVDSENGLVYYIGSPDSEIAETSEYILYVWDYMNGSTAE